MVIRTRGGRPPHRHSTQGRACSPKPAEPLRSQPASLSGQDKTDDTPHPQRARGEARRRGRPTPMTPVSDDAKARLSHTACSRPPEWGDSARALSSLPHGVSIGRLAEPTASALGLLLTLHEQHRSAVATEAAGSEREATMYLSEAVPAGRSDARPAEPARRRSRPRLGGCCGYDASRRIAGCAGLRRAPPAAA